MDLACRRRRRRGTKWAHQAIQQRRHSFHLLPRAGCLCRPQASRRCVIYCHFEPFCPFFLHILTFQIFLSRTPELASTNSLLQSKIKYFNVFSAPGAVWFGVLKAVDA